MLVRLSGPRSALVILLQGRALVAAPDAPPAPCRQLKRAAACLTYGQPIQVTPGCESLQPRGCKLNIDIRHPGSSSASSGPSRRSHGYKNSRPPRLAPARSGVGPARMEARLHRPTPGSPGCLLPGHPGSLRTHPDRRTRPARPGPHRPFRITA